MAEEKSNGGKPEEAIPESEQTAEEIDLAAEISALGATISEALRKAWNSSERQRIEQEVREGLRKFADEVETAAKNLRDSDVGQKVEDGVKQVREEIGSGKVAADVRRGTVQALRALRDALDRMADSFTPVEGEDKPKG